MSCGNSGTSATNPSERPPFGSYAGPGLAIVVAAAATPLGPCSDRGGQYPAFTDQDGCGPYESSQRAGMEGACPALCYERDTPGTAPVSVSVKKGNCKSLSGDDWSAAYTAAVQLAWDLLLTYADVVEAVVCAVLGSAGRDCISAILRGKSAVEIELGTSPVLAESGAIGGMPYPHRSKSGPLQIYCSSLGNETYLGEWVRKTGGDASKLVSYSAMIDDNPACYKVVVARDILHELVHRCVPSETPDGEFNHAGYVVPRLGSECDSPERVAALFTDVMRALLGFVFCHGLH